jgi:anti-anti-sigma factor
MAMSPSADPALQLSSARHGDAVVLSPRGRIDHASAEAFKAALAPHLERCGPGRPLILDLAGVDYIASVGLRVLMLASRQARAQGGTILVAALQPLVREIFEISKFTLVFPCFASVADAVADPAARVRSGPAGP